MSRFVLFLFLCLSGAALCADSGAPAAGAPVPAAPSPSAEKSKQKKERLTSMLPPAGTPFHELRLPRFIGRKLSSYITSDLVKMLTDSLVYGELIHVRLFNKDGGQTEAELEDAHYDINTTVLKSKKPVLLKDSRFTAEGSGIIMDTSTKEGFLYGPVKTTFQSRPSSSSTH